MTLIELRPLAAQHINLEGYRLGQPQRAGPLTVVPVFGPEYPGVVAPRSGIKLARVVSYGQVELKNSAPEGLAIVPLHMGYIQDSAQNHALCRSAFLGAGQTLVLDDACCVQQAQGGYLKESDQWFFVLPLELRARALELRGTSGFSKLWDAIGALNQRYGLEQRGHLEQILSRRRAVLTQFQSRLELLPGQIGALFFLGQRLAGLELAPSAAYFAEVWVPLVCFCYGVAAWFGPQPALAAEPFAADSLPALRGALERSRAEVLEQVRGWLADTPLEPLELQEEERFLELRLSTVGGPAMAGQVVTHERRVVYASLFTTAPDLACRG